MSDIILGTSPLHFPILSIGRTHAACKQLESTVITIQSLPTYNIYNIIIIIYIQIRVLHGIMSSRLISILNSMANCAIISRVTGSDHEACM